MKKLIMILIITTFAATAFAEDIYTSKTGFLNVRSEPGTHAKVLKVVQEGDMLTYTGEKHNNAGNIWIKVKDAKNAVGWVSKKYTKQLSSDMAEVAKSSYNLWLKLRRKPNQQRLAI